MGGPFLESAGAAVPGRCRIFSDPSTGVANPISATARTARSLRTAIRADLGEAEAYREALRRGEIGVQRPMGANVRGADFITAVRDRQGRIEIVVTDVKTTEVGKFPPPKTHVPGTWLAEVQQAVGPDRLRLNNPALEAEIVQAYRAGRVRRRQLNADYSPRGQGTITGW